MKSRVLSLSAVIFTLFFLSLLTRNGDIAFLNLFFIAYLFWGVIAAPPKESIKLTAERSVRKTFSDSELFVNVEVGLRVTNDGTKTVCLLVREPEPRGAELIGGNLKQGAALKAGETWEWNYSFAPSRGYFHWETLSVTASDPAGCLETVLEIPAPAQITVPPRYKRLVPLNIRPWETLSPPGIVPSRRSGSSTDFYGVREYHPGDPLRTLDWKRTARYRNKYFTREFQQERTADIAIAVDGRKNRDMAVGRITLFESMIELAASLSQMFLHQGQRVGFYVAGEHPRAVLPAYGKKQLYKILDAMAAARTGDDGSGDALYTLPVKQFTHKTQLFLLSPADREDIPYLRSLRAMGLQIFLIRPDTCAFAFADKPPVDLSENSLRLSRLEARCVKIMLSEMSVTVIDWIVGEAVQPRLMKAINVQRRIRRL